MAAGYGYLLLGIALLFGVACALLLERVAEWLRDGRWPERRRNTLLNRRALERHRLERESAQAVSLYRDPHLDAALRVGDSAGARAIAEEGLRRAFESGNEDLARLYGRYLQETARPEGPGPAPHG